MNKNPIENWSVKTAIDHDPEINKVFLKHSPHCIGCGLDKFCTLADVVELYKLEQTTFLEDIQKVIQTKKE